MENYIRCSKLIKWQKKSRQSQRRNIQCKVSNFFQHLTWCEVLYEPYIWKRTKHVRIEKIFVRNLWIILRWFLWKNICARRLSICIAWMRGNLWKDSERVIDIAIKYRYESPTAFTRAFKGFAGIGTSALKTENSLIQAFPLIRFHVSVDGGQPLKFRVEEKRLSV